LHSCEFMCSCRLIIGWKNCPLDQLFSLWSTKIRFLGALIFTITFSSLIFVNMFDHPINESCYNSYSVIFRSLKNLLQAADSVAVIATIAIFSLILWIMDSMLRHEKP
jgi:hypothetical protein